MSVWQTIIAFNHKAGLLGSALFATIAVVVTIYAVAHIHRGEYLDPIVAFWPIAAMVWMVRWKLLRFSFRFQKWFRHVGVICAIAFAIRPGGGWFPGDDWVMASFLAAYFALVVWWISEAAIIELAELVELTDREEEHTDDEGTNNEGDDQTAPLKNDGDRHTGR